MSDFTVLKVSNWQSRAVTTAFALIFFFCAFMAWRQGQSMASISWPAILVPLAAALGAVRAILRCGEIEATSESFRFTTLMRLREIAWKDVERIDIVQADRERLAFGKNDIVLRGGEKRITILGPMFWCGSDKKALFELLETKSRELELKASRGREG